MKLKLLEVLACPKCFSDLSCKVKEKNADGEVISGSLECIKCLSNYPIELGIPRFVERSNYASSFGYQWNQFKSEQIDSLNGTKLSETRFFSETGWTNDWLKGKWILDAGCGAGRFLDVASKTGCEVVGIDISDAVDAAGANMCDRPNVHLVQASIYQLPFRPSVFDGCYSIGVIQHTPDPKKTIQSLPKVLKDGGKIALTIYERKKFTLLFSKYLLRFFTTKVNKKFLLFSIQTVMPILFPLTEVLFRFPLIGRLFMFIIPVANYVDNSDLSLKQRYNWAILDTFDMLSPEYDYPQTQSEVKNELSRAGVVDIQRLNNGGLNLVGYKNI